MEQIYIILGIILLIFLLKNRRNSSCSTCGVENFSIYKPSGASEILGSRPRRIDYKRKSCLKKNSNTDSLVWEKRFPGLVGQRYSYDDSVTRTPCFLSEGAELKELPLDYKNNWTATIDAKLLKENPLLLADAKVAQQETEILQKMDGHLYNLAKKVKCIEGYNLSNSIPGQYLDRNRTSNEYNFSSSTF